MSEQFKSLEEMMNRYTFIKNEAFDFPLCEEFFDRLSATLQTHELREKPKEAIQDETGMTGEA